MLQKQSKPKPIRPAQTQRRQPGIESVMAPKPHAEAKARGSGKLSGRVALITGGDSGIGRAVAVAFAVEGADVAISYLNEHAKAALKHLRKGSSIINTTSVTAYRGSDSLIDYSATKGAIVTFTRSLAHSLVGKGIRVNGVAPGPIWTPLIPSTFPAKKVQKFGSDIPKARAGEPNEVAPCFVFLASDDASYFTGQVLHPNGGEIVNG